MLVDIAGAIAVFAFVGFVFYMGKLYGKGEFK